LVKVEASTVNPSDRLFLQGHYVTKPKLPVTAGFEGVGEVVDVKGETVKDWKGKHVCFTSQTGTWAHYTVLTPHTCFEIEKDVPLASSASGVVNPLTVLGFIDNYKNLKGTGIIHTAAASSLGRMLNKLCQK
jgi:NADPH:quinone reductase-like Zn-dependent oxidoreductase